MEMPALDGETVERLRVERLLSRAELSRLAQISYRSLSYIESGANPHTPRPATVQKLAHALGVEPGDLAGGQQDDGLVA